MITKFFQNIISKLINNNSIDESMSENKDVKLAKVASELGVGKDTIVEELRKKNFIIENNPNSRLTSEMHELLLRIFQKDRTVKEKADSINLHQPKTSKPVAVVNEQNQIITTNENLKTNKEEVSNVIDNEVAKEFKIVEETIVKQPQIVQPIIKADIKTEQPVQVIEEAKPEIKKADVIEKIKEEPKKHIETPISEIKPEKENILKEKKAEPINLNKDENNLKTTIKEKPVVKKEKTAKTKEEQPIKNQEDNKKEIIIPVETPVETPIIDKQANTIIIEQKEPVLFRKPVSEEDMLVKGPKIVGKIDLDALNKPKNQVDKNKQFAHKDAPKLEDNKDKFKNKKYEQPTQNDKNPPLKNKEADKKRTDIDKDKKPFDPNKQHRIQTEKAKNPNIPKDKHDKITQDVNINLKNELKQELKEEIPVVIERITPPILTGPKVVGKIELDEEKISNDDKKKKRKRKRIVKTDKKVDADDSFGNTRPPREKDFGRNKTRDIPDTTFGENISKPAEKPAFKKTTQFQNAPSADLDKKKKKKKSDSSTDFSDRDVKDSIRNTMAKMSGPNKQKTQKKQFKKQKKESHAEKLEAERLEKNDKLIQVAEFVTANDLSKLMDIPIGQIITTCFKLGMVVSINQRLDAEVIELVVNEFGFEVQFVSVAEQEVMIEEADDDADLLPRPPIVTIMGHVDHGKTSLLDYIRKTNVIAGEAGGITQHIAAYEVTTKDGKNITFLDTPGHKAFTAMRARGAKVTDIAVIVIAADDGIMPQTKEAISHAQAAGVPMIFAINKIDKPDANPERIKQQLSELNILVEDWGGDYQCQAISAKQGLNVDKLLDEILVRAEILELKANPNRKATGTVIEATLEEGRGYVATVLVQNGTLNEGDTVVAGTNFGRIKAMYNERDKRVKSVGPATPVKVLGLDGAPQSGDIIKALESERDAKDLANKRKQLLREQQLRSNKHITLEEIGRRLALGNFHELNLIIKGDVDGSVEALSDSLLQLSTDEVQIKIVHRGVGAITEADVLLASASDAIIIGFQVRPLLNARKQAENEKIEIKLYSIIYDAINDLKDSIEGMHQPHIEEKILCNIFVKEVFKITKVGNVAGCIVTEGKVYKDTKVRLIREGIVIHTGEIDALKRYKDDVKEVFTGMECGISIKNYNDIRANDVIEGYEQIVIKRKLQ